MNKIQKLIGLGVGYIFPISKSVRKLQIKEVRFRMDKNLDPIPETVRLEEKCMGDRGKGWKYVDLGWVPFSAIYKNRKEALIHRKNITIDELKDRIQNLKERKREFSNYVRTHQHSIENIQKDITCFEEQLKKLEEK